MIAMTPEVAAGEKAGATLFPILALWDPLPRT